MALPNVKDKENFLLKSLDVYQCTVNSTTNAITGSTLLGYTKKEKGIEITRSFAQFFDGMPEALVRRDITKSGASIEFELMEWTDELLKIATGGEQDKTDPTYNYVFLGSEPTLPDPTGWMLSGTNVAGDTIDFVIRLGRCVTETITIPTGSGDYQSIKVRIEAEIDPNTTDKQRNLGFWRFDKVTS